MIQILSFKDMHDAIQGAGTDCLCVAGGNDPIVMQAIVSILRQGLVARIIVTGEAASIRAALPVDLSEQIVVIDAVDANTCAQRAVEAVRSGEAGILMKGHVDSTSYLRAIVDRDRGIRKSHVLSNVTVAEMPSYHKLIALTDNGILPAPTLEQKRQIILNTFDLFQGLGTATVKVAAVAATEKISDRQPATMDAAALARESVAGQFPGFLVDGPFGYDVAVSTAAAQVKKLNKSPVAGDTDLLLFPSIEAANSVAKAWKFHGQAQTGSLVLGAEVPVLLNSRSDNADRRINSLLLALAARAGGGIRNQDAS